MFNEKPSVSSWEKLQTTENKFIKQKIFLLHKPYLQFFLELLSTKEVVAVMKSLLAVCSLFFLMDDK